MRPAQSCGLHFRFFACCSPTAEDGTSAKRVAVRRSGAAANCAAQRAADTLYAISTFCHPKGGAKMCRGETISGSVAVTALNRMPTAFLRIKKSPILNAPSLRPPFFRNRFCRGMGCRVLILRLAESRGPQPSTTETRETAPRSGVIFGGSRKARPPQPPKINFTHVI